MTMCATDPVCLLESNIAQKVGPQRYKLWFKDATRLTLTDEFVRIEVPNVFVGDWIERHCARTIQECAQEITGRDLEVAFAIDPQLARKLRPKQPDSQLRYADKQPERLARSRKRNGDLFAEAPLQGRFGDFVVGDSNRLACTCAMTVAEYPASHYNPLFIHGGCGLGKTHLLQAICHEIKGRHPAARWAYVTGEDFTNQFVYSIKSGERDAFRQRYRRLDVLVIDDVHFFANKRATQEEFLHTFNAIDGTGKQIVLASDAHPRMIGHLADSLVNRFLAGMVVKIDSPDHQTRVGVLRRRAAKLQFPVPDEVIEYVAECLPANVRELEGALLKLVALARLNGEPLTVPLAQRALSDMIEHTVPALKLADIESIVAIYFGLTPADLHTSRKSRTIALARGLAMFLARKHTAMSYPEIGRYMGNKNHSTVILAERRIARALRADGSVAWMSPAGQKQGHLPTIVQKLEEQLASPAGKN